MPARATRRGDLWRHLTRSASAAGARPADLQRATRAHPGWPACPAGCGWPVDPAAGPGHPGCQLEVARA